MVYLSATLLATLSILEKEILELLWIGMKVDFYMDKDVLCAKHKTTDEIYDDDVIYIELENVREILAGKIQRRVKISSLVKEEKTKILKSIYSNKVTVSEFDPFEWDCGRIIVIHASSGGSFSENSDG